MHSRTSHIPISAYFTFVGSLHPPDTYVRWREVIYSNIFQSFLVVVNIDSFQRLKRCFALTAELSALSQVEA